MKYSKSSWKISAKPDFRMMVKFLLSYFYIVNNVESIRGIHMADSNKFGIEMLLN